MKVKIKEKVVNTEDLYGEIGIVKYSDDRTKVQCHICGRYFKGLCSSHVPRKHGMTAYEYKKSFGLCNTKGLVGDETKEKYREKLAPNLTSRYKSRGGRLTNEPVRQQTKYIYAAAYNYNAKGLIIDRKKRIEKAKQKYLKIENLLSRGFTTDELVKLFNYKSAKFFYNAIYKLRKLFKIVKEDD